MRLGTVQFYEAYNSPDEWVRLVKKHGYRAVATPIDETASDDVVAAYRKAAEANDLLIAEVGVTRISRPLAWALMLFLLVLILGVPVAQHCRDRQMYDIFHAAPAAWRSFQAHEGTVWGKFMAANRSLLRDIKAYENALKEQSWSQRRSAPPPKPR